MTGIHNRRNEEKEPVFEFNESSVSKNSSTIHEGEGEGEDFDCKSENRD